MAKFCSKCGAQIDDNLMFCGNCGARVDAQPAPVAAPAPKAPPVRSTGGGFMTVLGYLIGKGNEMINWFIVLGLQLFSLMFIFLPLFRIKKKWFATEFSSRRVYRDNWGLLSKDAYNNTGVRGFVIILFIFAILLIGYILLTVILKKKANPAGGVALFVVQSTLYLNIFFHGLKIHDVYRESGYYVQRIGFSGGAYVYFFFATIAMYFLIVNLIQKRKELL